MILVGNGKLITRNNENPLYEDGCVAVEGNLIKEVGTTAELKAKYPDAEFVDAKGGTIMPGFINAHNHIYSAFARGLSIKGHNPKNFMDILDGQWWRMDRLLTNVENRYSAYATYMEGIKCGVTTVFDHHASYGEIKDSLFAISDVAKELGVRTCLCYEVSDRDGEDKMIRFDMSEFMESHSVSKLIGSPPGYVGFEDAGQLTEAVRRKPYSVVLFDEIEKAHPDVFNVLLQILEDGRLTDSHGRVVSFRNTIIILTSNIGSDKLNSKRINLGFKDGEQKNEKEIALDELKKFFRPELINRIDNIVVFNRLSKDVLKDIAKNMIAKLSNEIQKSNNITIALTDSAYDYLIKHGTNEDYGARPLRRLITSEIEDELADLILKGDKKEGDNILIDCVNDKLIFN